MSEKLGVFVWVLPITLGLILLEALWSYKSGRDFYDRKDTAANLFIMIVGRLIRPVFLGMNIAVQVALSEYAPYHFEPSPGVFLLTFLLSDFVYYWAHRLKHEVKFFWTFHMVHHSSPWMNFTTSFRINWFSSLLGTLFHIPLTLMGLPPKYILLSLITNLLFQFFLHTQFVPKLGPIEGIINTPSAHRVHHGSNDKYIDKNHGGVFMIWDRLFGTYQVEEEPVVYGITTGFQGHNPLWLIFGGFVDFARGRL